MHSLLRLPAADAEADRYELAIAVHPNLRSGERKADTGLPTLCGGHLRSSFSLSMGKHERLPVMCDLELVVLVSSQP